MSISRKLIPSVLVLSILMAVAIGFWWDSAGTSESRYHQALEALEKNDLRATLNLARQLAVDLNYEEHARYLRAACLVRTGDYPGALSELSSPPRREDLRAPMTRLVIESFYRSGRLAEAEGAARHLISIDNDVVAGHRWLASILYDLGANQMALGELKLLQTLVPDDYSPYHLMAQIEFDAEDYRSAAEACRKALKRHPGDAVRERLVRLLVESLVRQQDYRAAIEAATSEAGDDIESLPPDILALKAECHWALGETEKAQALIDRAVSLDPHERLGLAFRARVLTERGEISAAISILEELLQKDPHDFESRYKLATALQRQGNAARATTEMDRMRESQSLRSQLSALTDDAASRPDDADVRDELASVCDKLGKHELAESYRRAAEACRRSRQKAGAR